MKILIVNRFFGGAQIPTGRMAEDVARVLVKGGHEVTALASTGEYVGAARRAGGIRQTAEGIRGERVKARGQVPGDRRQSEGIDARGQGTGDRRQLGALRVEAVLVPKWMPRALAWLWFTWQARKRIPRMDWDVCVLMTDPPLLPLLAQRAAGMRHTADGRRKNSHEEAQEDSVGKAKAGNTATPPNHATRRVAVWLMDLYPEALAASGRIGTGNPVYRWYFEKRQRALGASDLLICLGQSQKELLDAGRIRHTADGIRKEGWEAFERQQGTGGRGQAAVGTEQLSRAKRDGVSPADAGRGQTLQHGNTEPPRPPLTQGVRTVVVPPWDDRGNIALATEESLRNLALYAGNLGEAHCFEEIIAAAPHLPGDWTIRFAARGAKLGALKEKAKGISHSRPQGTGGAAGDSPKANGPKASHGWKKMDTDTFSAGDTGEKSLPPENSVGSGAVVHVSGYASEEETPELLASARVHLITMSPGWEGIVVPSKLYGCIRTGRPVLFIGPENADTAREICAHDWGKVLPPGASGEEVAAAILELAVRETCAVLPQRGAAAVAKLIQSLATDGHG